VIGAGPYTNRQSEEARSCSGNGGGWFSHSVRIWGAEPPHTDSTTVALSVSGEPSTTHRQHHRGSVRIWGAEHHMLRQHHRGSVRIWGAEPPQAQTAPPWLCPYVGSRATTSTDSTTVALSVSGEPSHHAQTAPPWLCPFLCTEAVPLDMLQHWLAPNCIPTVTIHSTAGRSSPCPVLPRRRIGQASPLATPTAGPHASRFLSVALRYRQRPCATTGRYSEPGISLIAECEGL
jgi:hypothetical protein